MAAAAVNEKDKKRFLELTRMKYVEQAKWYLNGFWGAAEKEAEQVWKMTHKFISLDTKSKKEGCELDEFMAHHFLESLGETLTVVELRAKLRKIDLDANGKMALLEYLCFRYNNSVAQCVNNPQGGGPEHTKQMDEAARLIDTLNAALTELQAQLETQKKLEAAQQVALTNQRKAEADQRKALGEQNKALEAQRKAASEVKKAEDELRAAVNELHAQEKAYKDACQALEDKKNDEKLPAMKRSMASNELAQLKSKDPLPLNKAKITQGAALKRVEKERKASDEATQRCAEKTKEVEQQTRNVEEQTKKLEEQTRQVEAQTKKVEADQKETEVKMQAAHEALEELKKKGGAALGALWWMEREVIEVQKYLPQSKQTKLAAKAN